LSKVDDVMPTVVNDLMLTVVNNNILMYVTIKQGFLALLAAALCLRVTCH
jgi:hypothetical protein